MSTDSIIIEPDAARSGVAGGMTVTEIKVKGGTLVTLTTSEWITDDNNAAGGDWRVAGMTTTLVPDPVEQQNYIMGVDWANKPDKAVPPTVPLTDADTLYVIERMGMYYNDEGKWTPWPDVRLFTDPEFIRRMGHMLPEGIKVHAITVVKP